MKIRFLFILLLFFCVSGNPCFSITKLVILPERSNVNVDLNAISWSLVEEERVLTLVRGENVVSFSWENVNIDSFSIFLDFMTHDKKVRLINIEYPRSGNMVFFNIYSDGSWEEKVRIKYLLSGLKKNFSYRAVAENNEKTLNFQTYITMVNSSGEDFEKSIFSFYEIDLEKNLRNREQKKLKFHEGRKAKMKKELVWNSKTQPHDPEYSKTTPGIPVYYVIDNSTKNGLGKFPVWKGKVRVFQKDKSKNQVFLGEDWVKFVPLNDEIRINIGSSRDVKVKRKLLKTEKKNIRRNSYNNIVLYDRVETIQYTVENFKKKPLKLKIRDYYNGYWKLEFKGKKVPFEKKSHNKIEYILELEPKQKLEFTLVITTLNIR